MRYCKCGGYVAAGFLKPLERQKMGRSYTPEFVVKITAGSSGKDYTPMAWNVRSSGKPTDKSLAAWVEAYEKSTLPGGANAHLGPDVVWSAEIVCQFTGEVVACYKQTASFVVLG